MKFHDADHLKQLLDSLANHQDIHPEDLAKAQAAVNRELEILRERSQRKQLNFARARGQLGDY